MNIDNELALEYSDYIQKTEEFGEEYLIMFTDNSICLFNISKSISVNLDSADNLAMLITFCEEFGEDFPEIVAKFR